MNDTPTTEQVRQGYVFSWSGGLRDEYHPDGTAEFDRWLASEKAKAWNEGYDARLEGDNAMDARDWETVERCETNPYEPTPQVLGPEES